MKYMQFPEELLGKIQAGGPEGLAAFDQWNSVARSVYKRLHGKPDAKAELRFKTNTLHTTLMLRGLDVERGLQCLNEQELADFFDNVCHCGEDQHSAEALRRLRDRLRGKLEQSMQSMNPPPATPASNVNPSARATKRNAGLGSCE
ncbi:MAG TPA: hypothetical protein VGW33_08965 [Terriglobia bacterium]|nr:hypothetical protein [Terriglobia bacterium]